MDKLKPCPFCGGLPRLIAPTNRVWAECTDCGATGQMSNCGNPGYATEAWNTRADSDALTAANARIAELDAENKALREALEPFAKSAGNITEHTSDGMCLGIIRVYKQHDILTGTVGDLRCAAALLEKK